MVPFPAPEHHTAAAAVLAQCRNKHNKHAGPQREEARSLRVLASARTRRSFTRAAPPRVRVGLARPPLMAMRTFNRHKSSWGEKFPQVLTQDPS